MVCLLIFPAHVAEKEGNWEYLCGGDNSSDPLDSWSDNGYKRPLNGRYLFGAWVKRPIHLSLQNGSSGGR